MRHRLIGCVLVCLFSASIFAARYSANSPILRVNESATKFFLKKEGAVVSLAVENSSSSALTARVKLELIDPRDAVRATAMIETSVPSGSGVSTLPLVKIGAGDYDVRGLLWHRLRYEIAAIDSSGKESDPVSGLISLSEITPGIFRLLVSAPQEVSKEAKADKAFAAALSRALDYLAKRTEEIDEPYLIASYALAAMDAGEKKGAEKAVAKLRTLAREEAGTTYWNLESNTPFYGWGLAGRIETTALAVNALRRAGAAEIGKAGERDKAESLTNRELLFLLCNKDRHGVWLSTQATINVLDTLISLNEGEVAMSGATGGAEIVVNGKRVSSVAMPPVGQLSNPIAVDLSSFLSRGNNRVEIRRPGYAARASAQVVETHYEPWEQGAAARRENFRLRNSSALRLAVNYDKLEAKIDEEVVCNVTAERVGHYGYGMMLAEIGLPPGADVDRESLERAAQESGWRLNHYDVLPDRVIAYLWPQAGGLKFSFKFKPRYGLKAQTAPSALYDYYNPEARVVIAPSRFVVK